MQQTSQINLSSSILAYLYIYKKSELMLMGRATASV